ncbi:hypothetical protein [Fuerstiella marisgermanici]|uniref:Uncharacterized protein n=1 Tax=Fuerstiella marisgermanici TaxID=1891926 RepID=A0A1P8WKQ4_9PLAN|nr:hypothetical protein [Fuerstiella marisgermanici]APZ94623.1 hypothetical protein Fuma_04256 [Fuerstiella marisgermanici]
MAEPRHECVELATLWEGSHGDCYKHCFELRLRVERLVQKITTTFNVRNRVAAEDYLSSIGVDAPDKWIDSACPTAEEADAIEQKLRAAGVNLKVRRFREINCDPDTLGDAFYLERWSKRQIAQTMEWCYEVARVLGYEPYPMSMFDQYASEIHGTAKDIEINGDALDILQAIDRRPFDRNAALRLSMELTDVTHPDGRAETLPALLEAHGHWWNEQTRLLNWLIFKDRKLKMGIDRVESALINKPLLRARYRLLKSRKHPIVFSNVQSSDDLWNVPEERRTDAYMAEGFRQLQKFLNKKEFDHLQLTVTRDSAVLEEI